MYRNTRRKSDRRGSTLLMVLTAMTAAIVLSGAYLAAHANSAVVGANLASSSRARVEAESALAITLAALSKDDTWRTGHSNGLLFSTSRDDVEVRCELIDLATGIAPGEESVDIRATISARVGSIERIAEADFFIALPEQSGSIDVDLGEFALFAGNSIDVRSGSIVQPWSISPATVRGDPIRVATADGTPGAVNVAGSASIVGGVEFRPSSVSSHGGSMPIADIPDGVAVPAPAPPMDLSEASELGEPTGRIEQDSRIESIELAAGETIELADGASLLVEGTMELRNGAILKVTGNSSLVIMGDLRVRNAFIEVPVDARLDVHVGGELDFRNARVTEPMGTHESWIPELDRVRFLALAAREYIPTWRVRGNSLVKGECYAPGVDVRLQGGSILVGRIAARAIRIEGGSCLLYDPALDDRNGYTACDERAYDDDGHLRSAIAALEDLSTEQLAEASAELDIPLSANDTYVDPVEEEEEACQRDIADRWRNRLDHRLRDRFQRWGRRHGRIFNATIRHIGQAYGWEAH